MPALTSTACIELSVAANTQCSQHLGHCKSSDIRGQMQTGKHSRTLLLLADREAINAKDKERSIIRCRFLNSTCCEHKIWAGQEAYLVSLKPLKLPVATNIAKLTGAAMERQRK